MVVRPRERKILSPFNNKNCCCSLVSQPHMLFVGLPTANSPLPEKFFISHSTLNIKNLSLPPGAPPWWTARCGTGHRLAAGQYRASRGCIIFGALFSRVSIIMSFSISTFISAYPLVGFSGSRAPSTPLATACSQVLSTMPTIPVAVGCASGIDQLVRQAFPQARVFTAVSQHPGALAAH